MTVTRGDLIQLLAAAVAGSAAAQPSAAAERPRQQPMPLERMVQRLEDINEVQRVMARYEYFHIADMRDEMVGLFASKTPGVRTANNNFTIEGFDNVAHFMRTVGVRPDGDRRGALGIHILTTPVIEVASDGKTAQGVWISPGAQTVSKPGGGLSGEWTWIKVATDFVKEDGVWKIWRYHRYDIFTTPVGQSWAQVSSEGNGPHGPLPPGARPATQRWVYSPKVATENVPAPPTPYDVWTDATTN